MKCVRASVGIATALIGLATAMTGVPAHATFIYLSQAALTHPATSTRQAKAIGPTAHVKNLQAQEGDKAVAVAEEVSGSDTTAMSAEWAETGYSSSGISDDASGRASYYASLSPQQWTSIGGTLVRNIPHQYRATPTRPGSTSLQPVLDSPVVSAPKDSPADGVSVIATPLPVGDVVGTTPSVPDWVSAPPTVEVPVTRDIDLGDSDLIGVPVQTVPDPSTVGLLGVGLLLMFAATRRNRAHYIKRNKASLVRT